VETVLEMVTVMQEVSRVDRKMTSALGSRLQHGHVS